jgi:hypothetical protein
MHNPLAVKALMPIAFILQLNVFLFAQVCLDPDTTFITDCGTHIDLCMDEFVTEMGVGIALNITANDDLGILDPWDCDTLCGTKNGCLSRLPNGGWFYLPDPTFCGCDTFFYILNWRDTCSTQCYCEPGCPEGRIWTVNSMFLDSEPGDVVVYSKTDDTMDVFYNLQQYDMFFVDGSTYPHSNVNWSYELYRNGVLEGKENIHTSCSQEIFGKTFDFLRPISGCIALPHDGSYCTGVGSNAAGTGNSRYPGTPITVEGRDTTMVVITIQAPLTEQNVHFEVRKEQNSVFLKGKFSPGSEVIKFNIERSTSNNIFCSIYEFSCENKIEAWEFRDSEQVYGLLYYRLKIFAADGSIWFSNIKTIRKDRQKDWVKIYPNPGNGNFNLDISKDAKTISWIILDNSGRTIHTSVLALKTDVLIRVLNELDKGLYLIHLYNFEGQKSLEKLIVL